MRYLLIFLIVLLPLTAVAGDLFKEFLDIRAFIRSELSYEGSSDGPKSDTLLNTYIRVAIVVVNPLIEAKTTRVAKLITRGTSGYVLDSTVNVVSALIKIPSTDSIKSLVYSPRELWSEQEHSSTDRSKTINWQSRPSFFHYTDSSIVLFPTPSINDDSLIIITVQRQPDIDTLASLTQYPRKYRVAMVMYATYMVARAIQHPMTPLFRSDYVQHVANIQATLNRKQIGGAGAPAQ